EVEVSKEEEIKKQEQDTEMQKEKQLKSNEKRTVTTGIDIREEEMR
ncbi:10554_t:CDS:1, partial [Acaulospora morrowiae]